MNNNVLDKAYDIYFQSVSENAKNRIESAKWSAWGSGTIVIDGGLTALSGYELVPDSLEKARNRQFYTQLVRAKWISFYKTGCRTR